MAVIKVKNLQPGAVLSADVCDPNGRFLVGEGCVIEEKHIKALNAWGVISVEIEGDELSGDDALLDISPEVISVIEEQVNSRFIHNDMSHPFVKELTTETTNFFVNKLREPE